MSVEQQPWITFGDNAYHQANYSDALWYYTHALQQDPTNASILAKIANTYFSMHQPTTAENFYWQSYHNFIRSTSDNVCYHPDPFIKLNNGIGLTSKSQLVVIQPSDKEYTELASIKVADTSTYAYPIVAGNRVFIKDAEPLTLWAIE
jgi:hypothetical protein